MRSKAGFGGGEAGLDASADLRAPLVPLAPGWPRLWPLLLFLGFTLLGLVLFRGAFRGEFISDDFGYLVTHPYTEALTLENLVAIFDPLGPAKLYTSNYAPVHLLFHTLERQIFAEGVLGYHLVNVGVHALVSVLLVALLLASRVPPAGSLAGGLFFAVHPANVEVVAWMSQLKTSGALAFSLAALLAHRRHGGFSTLLFALGLLTKASAAFALPMAAALTWARSGERGGGSRDWAWLGGWAVLLGLFSLVQTAAFAPGGGTEVDAYADRWVHMRSVAAIGARYLVMATTSWGVSAFHEPLPALSPVDPWWLLALPAGLALAWRALTTLRSRREEGAWWVGAAAGFFPISQVFPFPFPVADRYLYFILPGLIGGSLLWARDAGPLLARALGRWVPALGSPSALGRASLAMVVLVAVLFGMHSTSRARHWRSETFLLLDAAQHYPEGGTAYYLRARRAAQSGDVELAVSSLRAAADRGVDRFMSFRDDPGLAPVRDAPAFQALIRDVAGEWIERARTRNYSTQPELRVIAHAHVVRQEYAEAAELLERALAIGGPLDEVLRDELRTVRGAEAAQTGEGVGRAADGAGEEDSDLRQVP